MDRADQAPSNREAGRMAIVILSPKLTGLDFLRSNPFLEQPTSESSSWANLGGRPLGGVLAAARGRMARGGSLHRSQNGPLPEFGRRRHGMRGGRLPSVGYLKARRAGWLATIGDRNDWPR